MQKNEARFVAYDDSLNSTQEETRDDFDAYIMTFKGFLDKDEISLVVYKLLYEYTFKEIAAIKKVTTNSVSSKYKRTIDKIRKYYGRK